MEARLIKKKNGYYLSHIPSGWHIGDTDHEIVKNHRGEQEVSKLSLKNCQAIELGYDLDELSESHAEEAYSREDYEIHHFENRKRNFEEGFQKAIEILGDKNTKLIQKLKDLESGLNSFKYEVTASYLHLDCNEIIQSLQQTEWDVEIAMECHQCQEWGYVNECRVNCNKKFLQPKLDSDGCLILKRKSN